MVKLGMRRRTGWRVLAGAVLAALVVGFLLVAPASLGGSTTWARTSGSSMSPGITAGDLVIARPQPTYSVGDVIAYPSRTLGGTVVVHRVVDVDNGRLVTKGDNNDWIDPDRPAPAEVLGAVSLHIPRGGQVLSAFTDPFVLIAICIALACVTGLTASSKAARRRSSRQRGGQPTARRRPPASGGAGDREAVSKPAGMADPTRPPGRTWPLGQVAAGAALAGLGLAVIGFGQPASRPVPQAVGFTHTAELGYSAKVKTDKVYEGGLLRTGDPVFLALAPVLETRLRYRLEASSAADLAGTVRSLVRLSAANGWARSLPLGPPRDFAGPQTEQSAQLKLADLRGLAAAAEKAAGTSFGGLTLTLTHELHLSGTLHGHRLDSTFRPQLSFTLDTAQATPAAASLPTGDNDALKLREPASIAATASTGATVDLLRWAVPVTVLRVLALLFAGAAAALSALYLALARRRAATATPFGGQVLHAYHIDLAGRPVIDLDDPAGLTRLTGRHDLPIIHLTCPGADQFLTVHHDTVYRYTQPVPHPNGATSTVPAPR